jgi:drug/metabolite transporter (DMT)-like permease
MWKYKRAVADLALLVSVLIWGTTFALMKDALDGIRPMNFIFLRFTLAFLVLVVVNLRKLKKIRLKMLALGFYLGLALTGGYLFQVTGLAYTTASKAGFITGLSVIIVPVLTTLYFKKLPPLPVLVGVVSATLGLLFLSYDGSWVFNLGDFLVFLCALSFGLHIFLVGQFVQKEDPALLTMVQIGVVALIAGIIVGIRGEMQFSYEPKIWWGIIYMAVMATGFTFFVQNWAQQFTSAIRTAIIFSMEPVFALIFAYLLLSEPITAQSLWGGGLILAGMLLAELGGHSKN